MTQIKTDDILDIIKKHMKENKITLSQYAEKSNISKAWLSRMFSENYKNISLDVAQRLLNVSGYQLKITKAGIDIVKIKRLGKHYEITR